ncbi:type II secretion system protein [bacterium]|nr:type II secretion system protein [bacterium]
MSKKMLSYQKQNGKKSAFTLIELLVAVAIFGILSVTLAQFLTSFLLMKFNAETRLRMRQEGNYALDRIEFLVRNGVTQPQCVGNNLRVNYQRTVTDYPQRAQVRYDSSNGQLFLVECAKKKHSECASSVANNKGVSLTTITGDGQAFKVTSYSLTCTPKDSFTQGFVVTVKFDLTYNRRVLSGNDKPITEHFERQVSVRNNNTFEE